MTNRRHSLRNIGIIAHVDAGKTTLSERILFYTGESHRMGETHAGTSHLDFDPQERARGITIQSAATTVHWRDVQINLIDTPGHIDFNLEVGRALRVLDGAVVVLDGVAGVEPQTETNWRLADRHGVPRLALVNKLDRVGADFGRVVDMLQTRLQAPAWPVQLPIGAEAGFVGVVDLLQMQARVWDADDASAPARVTAIPPALQAAAEAARARLVEAVAEHDDAILAAWLAGEAVAAERLRAAIRVAVRERALVPVLAASAFRNRGIEPLLDAVADWLPAPEDLPLPEGVPAEGDAADAPFAGLVFKLVADGHGSSAFVRVYAGRLQAGDVVLNAVTGQRERVARLYEVHADRRVAVTQAQAGDIVAIAGLKDSLTGHTLCDPRHVLLLETIEVPLPVIDLAIEPKARADQAALAKALQLMQRQDPSLRVRQDPESGQTLLSGMGELQLEVAIEALRAEHGVSLNVGRPQVAYRETVAGTAELTHVHKKQSGGPGQFAQLTLAVRPLSRGDGVRFESRITGGAVPREFIPAVEAGVRRAAQAGVLAGYPVVDFEVVLSDGAFHERDSSAMVFELAAASATRALLTKAEPRLLEPVMAVEVVSPPEYLGAVIGDLNRRRGLVTGQAQRGAASVVNAQVPLAEMFGYIGQLRALSSGRASYTMQLDGYQVAPDRVVAALREGDAAVAH
ncbi:elongation factor G [Comamonas serinivorans]|uniref:Elongation factor G n=1 Tax=Comamonas serinivorans TaxID=1082851 RepID=A0A1Y0EJG4_9BURK|nr:elongation factor G [Comamonas serinivorans]ARU03794.1 elongation factor G [Comamonas serinivorans]